MFAVGVLDDLREWSAPAKVSGMVLSGSVLYLFGVTMFYFRVPFAGLVVLGPDLAPLVTVLWVLGMANAVNLIDGLDGLAAGIVAIASGTYFLYASRLMSVDLLGPESMSPLLCVVVLGMCVGFLPHNFNPARIFMGDCGALCSGSADGGVHHGGRGSHRRGLQRPDLLLLRPAVHPAAHPRRAHPRHRLRHRAPGHPARRHLARPTSSTCTTGSCAWATGSAAAC